MVLVKNFGQYRANIFVAIGILYLVKSMLALPCTREEVSKIKGVQKGLQIPKAYTPGQSCN